MDRGSIRPRRVSGRHESLGSSARHLDQISFGNLGLLDLENPLGFYVTQLNLDRAAELGGDHHEVHRQIGFRRALADAGAAAAEQVPPPPPLTLVTKAEPPSHPGPAPLTGPQPLQQQPQVFRRRSSNMDAHQVARGRFIRHRDAKSHPDDEGQEPAVDCAPLRTTDIQLEPGETITDVAHCQRAGRRGTRFG